MFTTETNHSVRVDEKKTDENFRLNLLQKKKEVLVSAVLVSISYRQILISYIPKKNKAVVLLSTMHNDNKIAEDTGLPIMILDYKATKAAVDRVDQLYHNYSTQKGIKRWPLAYFYNCLNIEEINSMVIFQANISAKVKYSKSSTQNTFGKLRYEFASSMATATIANQASSKCY